jgi:hypothetical protein
MLPAPHQLGSPMKLPIRILVVAASVVMLTGCVSIAEVNSGFRRVDFAWDLDYQKTGEELRYRVIDAPYTEVYAAARETFLELGMPLMARDIAEGKLVARNTAPTPLTLAEWLEVKKTEEPRMKEVGGWYFMLAEDPKQYVVTVLALVRPMGGGKTFIGLDYELDAPEYRAKGFDVSKKAPPSAVKIASLKFWIALNAKLAAKSLPEARKRKPSEIDV